MDEIELIARIKANDEQAFTKLVHIYKPIIERFAFQFGIKDDQISDIVQETFLRIYRKIDLFHEGKLSTWIYQITLNITRDYYRKQKRQRRILDKVQRKHKEERTNGYYFEKHEHMLIHESLSQLELNYRIPIILFYFHDKTYEDIAIILNIHLTTVKSRIHRGKKKLKNAFEHLNRDEVLVNG
ncbi:MULTISPECIES: RNA polymerase sigma factor [unclassified Virgibacillus]|uniref:RNA polymerase sigma factor n=1 Tax=unclassified Virgibacillus TaxID=2620237 RepID=UPI0024DE8FA2|nr:RNA polymerase sigma factor [Virgibacillus sp. LDC-1]